MSDEKKHIINLGEASGLSDNDYLMIDSASQGTRKFKARGIVSGTFIDDTQESLNTTYSSSKIEDLLDDKTDIDDTQASVTSTYSSSKIEDLISNAPNAVELSYASYQALTEAEKTDGTIYMVYDDPSDGTSVESAIDYSTTEQNTGLKWIDGKPIYQKTFNVSANSYADISTLNIDKVVSSDGIMELTGGVFYHLNIYGESTYLAYYETDVTNGRINTTVGSGWTATNITVTLMYTKTTD